MNASITQTSLAAMVPVAADRRRHLVTTVQTTLFASTLFLSAALVFFLEPMFAKMVLPVLGGSPAVWNTCVVFFQTAMLVGYGYAHLVSSRLTTRRQVAVHMAVLVLAAFSLPIALPAEWLPPTDRAPTPWLLGVLAVTVGAPFLVISTTAPLLQKWFSQTDHPAAADPYFLYAASNLGSMLALVAYPFLVEPRWTLPQQNAVWAAGYGTLALMVMLCAVIATRRSGTHSHGRAVPAAMRSTASRVTWKNRGTWVALSAVPSSLMLAVTSHISTDVAAAPLLWILPLGLYLLSFVLGFLSASASLVRLLNSAMPVAVLALILSIIAGIVGPTWLLLCLHLGVFFVCAMVLHRQMAESRPEADDLTAFYLWIAVGGVLGSAFNTFLAPLIFTGVVEYPVGLALACGVRTRPTQAPGLGRLGDVIALAALGTATAATAWGFRQDPVNFSMAAPAFGVMVVSYLALARRSLQFALAIVVILSAGQWSRHDTSRTLLASRTFFGVHRVLASERDHMHALKHGSTIHGRQSTNAALRHEPLSYYHREGPIGQVLETRVRPLAAANVAVVGLGAGSLAAYARPGQQWTFFEIDPTVESIARDRRFFTYMSDCGDTCRVVLGDARQSLSRMTHATYDALILDAFSSDAIPAHLLTKEALRLYLSRLSPDGALVFHLSNRHLDLQRVVGALASDAGLPALVRLHSVPDTDLMSSTSEWLVMARSPESLASFRDDARWRKPTYGTTRAWTDDYSDLLAALR